MSSKSNRYLTAVTVMAVLYLTSGFIGCATSRQIDEVKAQISEVEMQNRQSLASVMRLDSMITEEMESNKKLRNEMNVTVSDLQQQIASLMENNQELMHRLEALMTDLSRRGQTIIKPSPGAQDQRTDTVSTTPPAPSINCQETYDESFIQVRRGEYEKAITGFQTFLSECRNHELAENAYYWIGECYYSMEKYTEAIAQFETLLSTYKASVNASRALYKLGRSQQELGKKEEAKKVFKRIVDEFPGSLEAEQAKERLKELS
jgi:tol-pal system protein YbgF